MNDGRTSPSIRAETVPSKKLFAWIDANRATMTPEQLEQAEKAHLALRTLEMNVGTNLSPALMSAIKEALKDFADGMGGQ